MVLPVAQVRAFLEAIPDGDPWTVHRRNGDAMALAAWAITPGWHVSIGLGDYPYSRFGKPRNSGGHAGRSAGDPTTRNRAVTNRR